MNSTDQPIVLRLPLPAGELTLTRCPPLPGALVLGTGAGTVMFRLTGPAWPGAVTVQIVADELAELVDLPAPLDELRAAAVQYLSDHLPAGDIRAAFLLAADRKDLKPTPPPPAAACFDTTCPKCRQRFGWAGHVTDAPPCPRCGARLDAEDLAHDQAILDETRRLLIEGEDCPKCAGKGFLYKPPTEKAPGRKNAVQCKACAGAGRILPQKGAPS